MNHDDKNPGTCVCKGLAYPSLGKTLIADDQAMQRARALARSIAWSSVVRELAAWDMALN